MNLALAFLIFTFTMCGIGFSSPTNTINKVLACVPSDSNPNGIASTDGSCGTGTVSPAVTAGLRVGDTVTAINGVAISDWSSLRDQLAVVPQEPLTVELLRNGQSQIIKVMPVAFQVDDYTDAGVPTGSKHEVAFIGVMPSFALVKQPLTDVVPFMWSMSTDAARSLMTFPVSVARTASNLFSSDSRDPSGPVSVIGMSQMSGSIFGSVEQSWLEKLASYLSLLASVNLFLFLFNLLPILPLDGGHIAGALYEGARRLVSRVRGTSWQGHVDTARLLPMAYVVTLVMIGMSVIVMLADIVKPISL